MPAIGLVGLGHVGLPLAVAFDEAGSSVVGYDIDPEKIRRLQNGCDPTGLIDTDRLASSDIAFTTEAAQLQGTDYVIIAVPTPLDAANTPDVSSLESTGLTVGRYISPGTTVTLESTVYPGATREILVPALEETSNLEAGADFSVAYTPERINPGNNGPAFAEIVKLVGGLDGTALERAATLYETVVDAGVYRVPSIEVAETAKCLENTQRDANIALINEFAMACHHLGIDSAAVLDAANTKWNFHDYTPGLVGGHCLPVDPHYLAYAVNQAGYAPELIRTARETNEQVSDFVAELVIDALAARRAALASYTEDVAKPSVTDPHADGYTMRGDALHDERLLVLGLTYKANSTDIRGAPIRDVIDQLQARGLEAIGYDPYADTDDLEQAYSIPIQETLNTDGADGILVSVPHDEFLSLGLDTLRASMNDRPVLIDVMGAFRDRTPSKHGFHYKTL
jgi:UDP-N-acetyl-D-galactosamine dehydrogenase